MRYYNSIVETIGNTPLVKLNSVTRGVMGTVLSKVEYFNPGNSVKDRMAIKMIDDAEERGDLKPGGTIIEGTSGNTGMGLALIWNRHPNFPGKSGLRFHITSLPAMNPTGRPTIFSMKPKTG